MLSITRLLLHDQLYVIRVYFILFKMYLNQQYMYVIHVFHSLQERWSDCWYWDRRVHDHRFLRCLFLLLFWGHTSACGKLEQQQQKVGRIGYYISVPHHIGNFHCDIKPLLTSSATAHVLCLLWSINTKCIYLLVILMF